MGDVVEAGVTDADRVRVRVGVAARVLVTVAVGVADMLLEADFVLVPVELRVLGEVGSTELVRVAVAV